MKVQEEGKWREYSQRSSRDFSLAHTLCSAGRWGQARRGQNEGGVSEERGALRASPASNLFSFYAGFPTQIFFLTKQYIL